jgi:NADH-quinone oxidoreductase subunit G
MTAHLDVHEPKPPDDPDSPLSFSMEGYPGQPPAALLGRYWAPGWNSVQSINKFQIEVGGPLHGGDPGRRLIEAIPANEVEPRQDALPPYCADIPAAFAPRAGRWWIVPAHHIFGSEELSIHAPGIAQLAPKPYVAIPSAEAERLGLTDGQDVTLTIGQRTWRLPVKARPGLPAGVAIVPSGLPELTGLELPAWAEIQ